MSLVQAEALSKRYGEQVVLSEVSFQITRGERIALIGDNGSGKSTLLKLIAGLEEPTSGAITQARAARIGYLPQEPVLSSGKTLFAEMLLVFAPLSEKEKELRRLEGEISHSPDPSKLLQRYDRLREDFERAGGYRYESEIRQVLAGLGFVTSDWERPLSEFSGGEWARASLAKLIMERPDLLLLDEPSNHLDLAALEWLEDYLERWKGGYVLVSHDRLLLDRLSEKTWEIDRGRLSRYRGNYSQYRLLRAEREERQIKLFERQQMEIVRMEEFVRRARAGQKHKQAKDREKKLGRLERVESPGRPKRPHFRLALGHPGGEEVLKLENLIVGYPEQELLRCPDLTLRRGERVVLLGPNGSGKTTLLRTIFGEAPPLCGAIELGYRVVPGYFAQVQEFDRGQTLVEVLLEGKPQEVEEARSFLGRFLFSGEEVFKQVEDLSGGELSRLALARLAQIEGNLLLLDEPTNHLDISAQEVLQEALEEYRGTTILVSHDRYLVDRLASQVWEIRRGELQVYQGDYSCYRRRQAEEAAAAAQSARASPRRREQAPPHPKREEREAELLEQAAEIEEKLTKLEEELAEASYAQEPRRIAELHIRYKEQKRELEEVLAEWDLLS